MTPTTQAAPRRSEGPPHDASNVTRILRPLMEVRRMPQVRLMHAHFVSKERAAFIEHQVQAAQRSPEVAARILTLIPIWYDQIQRMGESHAGERVAVSTSEISDPTPSSVIGHDRALTEMEEGIAALAEWVAMGRTLEARFTRVRRVADAQQLAEVKDALRCTGGQGMPGGLVWGRPDCTELSLQGPLCGPCSHESTIWALSPAEYAPRKPSDGRRGARPKWDALMAAGADNLRAGLEQIIQEVS